MAHKNLTSGGALPHDPSLERLPEPAFSGSQNRGVPAGRRARGATEDVGSAGSDPEAGSTTVEYSIGAIATAAFAGLLLAVLKSGGVKGMLTNIIQSALSI